MSLRALQIDPRIDSRWLRLLSRHEGRLFLSPSWLGVLTETYGFRVSAVIAVDETGEPRAGLPFCAIATPAGTRLVSLPFSDYCDPMVSDSTQWECLAAELLRTGFPITLRCLQAQVPTQDPRFSRIKTPRWHGVDLDRDLSVVERRFDEPARRQIRKARQQLRVEPATDLTGLRQFYELHLRLRKYKYRLFAQPYLFFERIWHAFLKPGRGVLLLASHDGRVVAGTLYLEWDRTLYYKFNASDPAYLALRPNDMLVWEGIRHAVSRGCRQLDFGLSDEDQPGLLQFKRKFGSQERIITFLRHVPQGYPLEREQELGRLLGAVTALLTQDTVPDSLTEAGAEILYRYFA